MSYLLGLQRQDGRDGLQFFLYNVVLGLFKWLSEHKDVYLQDIM